MKQTCFWMLSGRPKTRKSDLQPEVIPSSVRGSHVTPCMLAHHPADMVESLLLLLWRHLLYYANDARGALNPVKPNTLSLSSGVFASSQSEMSRGSNSLKLLERIAANLRGSLDRLEDVDVVGDLYLDFAATDKLQHTELRRKGSESYYAMLIRRLGELTAGLTGDFGTGDASS